MYNYTYDPKTGGVLLNTSPLQFSKEPRPVYYKELDLLGLDKYWKYEKQDALPYMWAEANKYYYFGRLVAQTKGGNLYTAPEIEIKEELSEPLRPVDINTMIEKNTDFLQVLEQDTVKKIYDVWQRYKDKLDVFHVAFSGGKDSIVLLDLVKKALPKDEFVVVFGDTQMEFPDTYDVVDKIEAQCKAEGIRFYRAKSHMGVRESWQKFGPPSRILRWCCYVHKSVPKVIKLRKELNKTYKGLDFVGVRAQESFNRSGYDYESYGKKTQGQYSHNSILEWTSAEVWLHIYCHNLIVNEAYKMGNQRVGCVLCPMSAKTDYIKNITYRDEISELENIVLETYTQEDIISGYWCARSNGVQLKGNEDRYLERYTKNGFEIEIRKPSSDWHEWIKTLGVLPFDFVVDPTELGYIVKIKKKDVKAYPKEINGMKKVFRKSAFCIECGLCEINCMNNSISFSDGVKITNCSHCQECHQIDGGCMAYNSLKTQTRIGGNKMKKSIDVFGSHAPKTDWFEDFFERKGDFLISNSLGPDQKSRFKRFLNAAKLIEKDTVTDLTDKLSALGWDSSISLGIMLANLAYNPQFEWYIKNLDVGRFYTRAFLMETLKLSNSNVTSRFVLNAFKRIVQTPFGLTLNFGYVDSEDNFTRNKCIIGSPLVVLYSLYKFAEACGDYYEFTVNRLLNYNIDSDGISPTQIFGIEEDEMKTILQGLTASNPDFITAKFTHDLDTISLNKNMTASDVLSLL